MSIDPNLGASIAATRFGLGARPGEIDAARADPKGYLRAQIRLSGADQPPGSFQSGAAHFVAVRDYQMQRRQNLKAGLDPVQEALKQIRATAIPEFLGRAQLGAQTDASFRERWTLFWCNHFTVASKNLETAVLVGPFEREAIRPHVFGRFEDLLTASTMHPAMLLYLDQAQSIGPHSAVMSMAGPGLARFRQSGLNENLAREILELHTLGVGSGYTQADVTEFARALTGWSIQGPNAGQYGGRFASAGRPANSPSARCSTSPARAICSARATPRTASPRRARSCTISPAARPRPATSPSRSPAISSPTTRRRPWWRGSSGPICSPTGGSIRSPMR